MNTISNLAAQSELAFAVYANLHIGDNTRADFISNDSKVPEALADSLAARYRVIDILNDPTSGAYAVVFEDKTTGARTLAIRGTSPGVTDIAADTYLLIGVPSNLNPQYKALEAKVIQWQGAGIVNSSTTLTGHSLGGYLATAIKSTTPATLGATYTFNAPGLGSVFGTATQFFQNTFGVAAFASDVYDVRGTQGLSFIGGLGQHWGTSVPVEIEAASGAGLGNHSIGRINQPLAVLGFLAQLDPSLTLDRVNQIVQAASNQADNTLEKVLNAAYSFVNGNSTATAIGDDQALYQRLTGLQSAPAFQSLAGKVTLSLAIDASLATNARTDFAAAVALTVLSPIALTANGPDGQAALDALWQTAAWNSTYQNWLSDYAARQSGGVAMNFTDTYLNDRQALLQNVITANLKDAVANSDGYLAVQGTTNANINTRFIDLTSCTFGGARLNQIYSKKCAASPHRMSASSYRINRNLAVVKRAQAVNEDVFTCAA